ncbi:hypothetical protein IWW38_004220, partial [Coemansia aciculifera]
ADWEKQEMVFLANHLFTLIDCGYPHSTGPNSEVPLVVVPQFHGSFDAPNIEMAVSRSRTVRTVRLSSLVDDLMSCLEFIDNKEPFTVVSLCRLTDRQTRSTTALALLVSHGSNSQRFGVFPHNDVMLGRLIAGNESLWHEYRAQDGCGLTEEPQAAFAYAQSGIKYTFFVRLKGHFFEMTRDEDWVPTMVPTRPRATWAATGMTKAALLSFMSQDTEKVLAGMVEMFGLRLFCYGFFEAIAIPPAAAIAAGSPSRRISEDPSMVGGGHSRRSQNAQRGGRRNRVSAGTIGTLATSGNNSPYRRHVGHHGSVGQQVPNVSYRGDAMPFLSPQARNYNSFPSVDMTAMSVSLPNSPFFGFPLDGQQFAQTSGGVAHESLFPSLSDASLVGLTSMTTAGRVSDDALAVNMYPAVAATTVQSPSMGQAGCGLDASSLFNSVGTAGSGAGSGVIANSPAFWDLSSPHQGQHMGFRSPHSMAGLTGSMTDMSMAAAVAEATMHFGNGSSGEPSSIALYPPAHASPAMLGWDDMAGVLSATHHRSSDMLMQLAQPSPTLTHYNLSAQATPAFEAYSTPVLSHLQTLSASSGVAMQQHPAVAEDPSAMAAYFGVVPPNRSTNSTGSQDTLTTPYGAAAATVSDGQLAKAYMYSTISGATPGHQMDLEFPASSY